MSIRRSLESAIVPADARVRRMQFIKLNRYAPMPTSSACCSVAPRDTEGMAEAEDVAVKVDNTVEKRDAAAELVRCRLPVPTTT